MGSTDEITYSSSKARHQRTRRLRDPIEKPRTRHLRSTFVWHCNQIFGLRETTCTSRMVWIWNGIFIPTTIRGLERSDLHLPIRIERLVSRDFELAQFWRWHRSIFRWRIILVGPRRPARTRRRGENPLTSMWCHAATAQGALRNV
jgi:hypothetical protein